MGSILNRYESIMAANVCGMVELSDDPMKMVRHLMHHMEDDLSKTRREGSELISEIEKLEDDMSVPNAEGLLVAKKAELMKLHEINEKLAEQLRQLTVIRASIYQAQHKQG